MRYAFANLDFGTRQRVDRKTVDELLTYDPDLLGFVEAKVNNVRKMFGPRWIVAQWMSNKAKRGIAVAWRPDKVKVISKRMRAGVSPGRARMLPRWLRIVDVKIDGRAVRLIFAHRPPPRYRWLWPAFDRMVKLRLRTVSWGRKGRWAVFADHNTSIFKMARIYKGRAYGEGIMGVVVGPGMMVKDQKIVRRIRRQKWTDHVGVVGDLHVKEGKQRG